MANANSEKLLTIEEQIKKLQDKKKKVEKDMYLKIGKMVFSEWDIDSELEAISIIEELKSEVSILKGRTNSSEGISNNGQES